MFDLFKRKPKPEPSKTAGDTSTIPLKEISTPLIDETTTLPRAEDEPAITARVHTSQDESSSLNNTEIEKNDVVESVQTPQAVELAVQETVSKSFFARTFGGLFSRNPKLDPDLLDELETALIMADVGVKASSEIMAVIQKRFKAREFGSVQELLNALRQQLLEILAPVHQPLVINKSEQPFVLLTVGVNGAGKTTTIGKLARRFQSEGHSLMLAAGDTFRAAAVQQLQIWGERNNVAVISQGQDADPASVAFDALQAAKARKFDILIADTAGRLHTQTHLMAELTKIKRVLAKIDPSAPHEVLLVIDGTTGQNAINQCRAFNEAVGVTGLVVTKLDGSAKGGVLFALAREFGIPIRFIGLGEKPEDLRPFDPITYVDALLPKSL
jgi:fused signal recognition particle receptor